MARGQRTFLLLMMALAVAQSQQQKTDTSCGEMSWQCCDRLITAAINPQEKAIMALSSGTSLPFDAGKYQMCLDGKTLQYFLTTMSATTNAFGDSVSMPVELGLCLPDSCVDSDIPAIVKSNLTKQMIPALSMVELTNITATSPQLDVRDPTTGTWIATGVVVSFALLVVLATLAELNTRYLIARNLQARSFNPNASRDNVAHWLESGEQSRPSSVSGSMHRSGSNASMRQNSEPAPEPSESGSMTPRMDRDRTVMRQQEVDAANQRLRAPGKIGRMVQPFSLFGSSGTLPKVVECPPYKPTDCLNGLRAISMFWIVLGHTFLMPKGIAGYSNDQDILASPLQTNGIAENSPGFMFVLGAQISVDTFFFLSGFLLSMLTLQELRARRGKTNLFMAVVLRYVRLTPSLALAMLAYYQIIAYLGHGPFNPRFQQSVLGRCDGSWWSELTYSMNFAPFGSDKVCMGWTWYLGDDMIFFIVSIAILPLYYRQKWLGWVTVGVISVASFVVTIWLVLHFNLSPYVFDNHYTDYSYWSYSKPYSRIPAYFVGLVTAWVLDDMETIRNITRANRHHTTKSRILGMVAFLCCLAVLIFITIIPVTDFGTYKNKWDSIPGLSAVYLTFSRPIWAFAWAVITLLCYYDYLPIVNGFLSHSFWTPFARLTYGAYLCHPIVIKLAAGNATQYYNYSSLDLFYRWLGNTGLAYGGALVLWCLVERPTMTFTSMLLKKKPPAQTGRTTSLEKPLTNQR